jgi:hypothetical protein
MPAGVPEALSLVQQINGTNPAAGVEVTETVPADRWWRLLCVTVQLVQGLTQTPQPILVIDDGTDVVYQALGAAAAQAASTTARYTWAAGLPMATAGATPNIHHQAPLPEDLVLEPGWRVRTSTLGIGANSDYGAPSLLVVEYGA